ncbi:MAG: acyltransferase [Caldilineaceae bacterium]|nr:acyltransferase [Caldilineaceae bacterium]MDE0336656.1 acyltransferase [Caldilineaceae bacterium]
MILRSWTQAAHQAAQAPPERNRYVDLLRAASICLVILGHWLVVVIHAEGNTLSTRDIRSVAAWVRWLTWLFQVMPIFFLVGGYVNALGWQSAQRRQDSYAAWLARRLQRLVLPVLPVLAAWTLIGAFLTQIFSSGSDGLPPPSMLIKTASQFALLPAWFLVVYILMILLTPLSYRAWQRYGLASFGALTAAAALTDLLALGAGWQILGWLNYLFVWLAVHQLGYAWQAGRIGEARRCLLWAAGGLAALIALVSFGPYPVSMVSMSTQEISNSLPPRVTLLALGVAQTGLLLALERPARRLLERGALWTTTVLINGMIMTVFLWHVTVLVTVVGLIFMTVGWGSFSLLSVVPGTSAWWLTRPLWIAVLAVALIPFIALFNRFEHIGQAQRTAAPPAWRLLLGCTLVCLGLSILTLRGIPTAAWPGINLLALGLPFVGAALIWFGPRRMSSPGE